MTMVRDMPTMVARSGIADLDTTRKVKRSCLSRESLEKLVSQAYLSETLLF
jgi:hypothetical protein